MYQCNNINPRIIFDRAVSQSQRVCWSVSILVCVPGCTCMCMNECESRALCVDGPIYGSMAKYVCLTVSTCVREYVSERGAICLMVSLPLTGCRTLPFSQFNDPPNIPLIPSRQRNNHSSTTSPLLPFLCLV